MGLLWMDIEIKQRESDSQGEYYIALEAMKVAEMTYSKSPGRIIINHTGVNKGYEGQGLGKKLVYRAVEDARNGGYAIVPLCPFEKKVINGDRSL